MCRASALLMPCSFTPRPRALQEELDKMKSSLGNAILEEKPNVK